MSNADRDTLLALAERVEKAHGANIVLERDIALAIYPGAKALPGNDARISVWDGNGRTQLTVKPYTASLDTAKTLVPQGWHVGMLTECDEDDSPSCCLTENEEPCRQTVGRGADMALSLAAASLRARAGDL